ncbi:MAG: amino acid ABC transporter permease, partial [Alphaproteobacteria bacterium]
MSCWETIADYGLRSIGIGERLLPRTDFTLCQQFTLIGSGLIWNIYFGTFALLFGFFLATAVAVGKAAKSPFIRKPAEWFIFVFRGSPLFIQFFLFYEAFVLLPKVGIDINLGFVTITAETRWLTRAWLGALIVMF